MNNYHFVRSELMKTMYIMLTRTASVLCKVITAYTKDPYGHVSILFAEDFTEGYSFSRKYMNNPFIGTFNLEHYPTWIRKFPNSTCCIFALEVEDDIYDLVYHTVHTFYADKDKYSYNFIGLVGRTFNMKITPENSYFCSQFVSFILEEAGALYFGKEPICVTPGDFYRHPDLKLIYEGSLTELFAGKNMPQSSYLKQAEGIVI